MTKKTRIGLVAGAGVGAAAASALRRRWGRKEDKGVESASPGPAAEAFLDHLAAAVRIPTVSYEELERIDYARFEEFRDFLASTYPQTFDRLDVEPIAGHSLLLRWDGTDPGVPPVLLMSHYDVVPVEEGTEEEWEHPPFAAERGGEHLWGRGVLDDKGAVIGVLEAVEALLNDGFRPDTTLYLSIGHDEEIGGRSGAAAAAATLQERGVHFDFVLDEGGAVVEDFLPGASGAVALLGIGEKGYVNVQISAGGAGGHSSTPPEHTAIGRVAAAVAALEASPMPARLEVQRGLFAVMAKVLPGFAGIALRRPEWFGSAVEKKLSAAPQTNALIRTTGAVTVIEGGLKANVLPQHAAALVNYRILPGDTVESVLAHVRSVVGSDVEVTAEDGGFTTDPSPLSDTESASFRLLASTIEDVFPDARTAPWILMGATDSRYMVPLADNVYRFAPFRMTPVDMGRIHGTGERIRLADAGPAVTFYARLIRRATGTM